jgi:hercynylcysteine S-oxide lyase
MIMWADIPTQVNHHAGPCVFNGRICYLAFALLTLLLLLLMELVDDAGTRDYTAFASLPSALDFRTFLGGEDQVLTYCHDLTVKGGNALAQVWGTSLLVAEDMSGFMINIILPSTDTDAVAYMRQTLDDKYGIYIVYDKIPSSLSSTGKDILFTRLSAQVYLELTDYTQLGELVPQLLAEYESQK